MGLCYMVTANPSGSHWWPSLPTHSSLTQFADATVSRTVILPDNLLRSVCSTNWNVAEHKTFRSTKSQEGTRIVCRSHKWQCTLKEPAHQSMPTHGLTVHQGILCCYTNLPLGCRRVAWPLIIAWITPKLKDMKTGVQEHLVRMDWLVL